MIYWDTSALIPVFVSEIESDKARAWLRESGDMPRFTSWLTLFEFEAVLRRKLNQSFLNDLEYQVIQEQWTEVQNSFNFVSLDNRSARMGARLQKLYALKPYDSIQIGSAALLQMDNPNLKLACFDEKLAKIARQESIPLLN